MSDSPEALQGKKPKQKWNLKQWAALTFIGAATAAAGYGGYADGKSREQRYNRDDLAAAAANRNCAKAVGRLSYGGATNKIRLGLLTKREQTDCGFDFSSASSRIDKNVGDSGAKVLEVNYDNSAIQLPDPAKLEESAASSVESGNEFSHAEEIVLAVPYSVFGALGAVGVLAGGLRLLDRRKEQDFVHQSHTDRMML